MPFEEGLHVLNLAPSAARTANGNSGSLDFGWFDEILVYLDITAVAGTSPTLDVKVQTSYNNADWFDLPGGAFPQKTAAGKDLKQFSNYGRFIRAAWTVGGTTPSFTFRLDVVAKNL